MNNQINYLIKTNDSIRLSQLTSEVPSSQIETDDGVGKSVSLVDWDCVGDTIPGVEDNTGGTSGGVQGEDSL